MRSQRLLETRKRVLEVLKRLAKELNATIYLFGSYARGDHTLESDVDIIVVSEIFEGMDLPSRAALIRTRLPGDLDFDIIPLTPRELERLRNRAFYRHVASYWIEVKPE